MDHNSIRQFRTDQSFGCSGEYPAPRRAASQGLGNVQFNPLTSHELEETDCVGGAGGSGDADDYSMMHD